MINAVFDRRSIRKYKEDEVSKELIEQILGAGIAAPSSKNRQPWRFIVVSKDAKKDMLLAMSKGIEKEKNGEGILHNSRQHLNGAEYTLKIMQEAPVTIFIVNPLGKNLLETLDVEERIYEICNMQSIGAAMENMTLAATELGLGSLWICDIFFAYEDLTKWLGLEGEMIAAMTIGYADESPASRPRKKVCEITQWRD